MITIDLVWVEIRVQLINKDQILIECGFVIRRYCSSVYYAETNYIKLLALMGALWTKLTRSDIERSA